MDLPTSTTHFATNLIFGPFSVDPEHLQLISGLTTVDLTDKTVDSLSSSLLEMSCFRDFQRVHRSGKFIILKRVQPEESPFATSNSGEDTDHESLSNVLTKRNKFAPGDVRVSFQYLRCPEQISILAKQVGVPITVSDAEKGDLNCPLYSLAPWNPFKLSRKRKEDVWKEREL